MEGSVVDLVILAAVALFAYTGYKQGLLVGALSFGGFVGGAAIGLFVAPTFANTFADGRGSGLVGIALVLFLATIGQLVGTTLGGSLRRKVTWHPARMFDAGAGAVVSVAGVLVVAWGLGNVVKDAPFPALARSINQSIILERVSAALPPAPDVFRPFTKLLDDRGFPQVFNDIGRDTRPVEPPDPAVVRSHAVTVARDRVLKILGVARSCSRRLEGTGFVYAHERVMTNAHVVAGVKEPEVEVGSRRMKATVVLFDPGRDVAVLHVPGLDLPPLRFAGVADTGDDAIVAGYPEDGPFTATAARIREQITAVGKDIYQRRNVKRDVYALRAVVRPGNSGGPLLAPDGRVYGVIFAAAADDRDTGYALTAAEVRSSADTGARSTAPVSTQGCD